MNVIRHGYINSKSSKGKPTTVTLLPETVIAARVWVNTYGNPSYTLRLADKGTLYLVDDYGAMNGIKVTPTVVKRKSDLFAGWVD